MKEDQAEFPPGSPGSSSTPPPAAGAGAEPPPPPHPGKPPGYKGTGRPAGSRTRNRGRFAKAPTPQGGPAPQGGASTLPPDIDSQEAHARVQVDYDQLANVLVEMTTEIMASAIGPEWRPGKLQGPNGISIDERITLTRPLAIYMESKELPDLPPGVVVLLAIGLYSSRRFHQENTRKKFGWMFKAAKEKIFGFFRRKKKNAPPAPPKSDSQPATEGQIDESLPG